MTYRKGTPGYKLLTDHVRKWANKIVLQLAKATPGDYILTESIHKESGVPHGPRGMIRSFSAALTVIDAYKGLIPPNWGHVKESNSNGIPAIQPMNREQADHYVCDQQSYYGWDTPRYSHPDDEL
jgi:hypothetical protein